MEAINKLAYVALGMTIGAALSSVVWYFAERASKKDIREDLDHYYESLDRKFKEYRKVVQERYGEDIDRDIMYMNVIHKNNDIDEDDPDVNDDIDEEYIYSDIEGEDPYVNNDIDEKTKQKDDFNPYGNPYLISPDEFGEIWEYEVINLYFYSDHLLVDDNGDTIDDPINIVGVEAFNKLWDAVAGKEDIDVVYIRNDERKIDIEVLIDRDKLDEHDEDYEYNEEDIWDLKGVTDNGMNKET